MLMNLFLKIFEEKLYTRKIKNNNMESNTDD